MLQPHSKKLVDTQRENYERWYKEGYHTEAYLKQLDTFEQIFESIDFENNPIKGLDFGCGNTGGMAKLFNTKKYCIFQGYDPHHELWKDYPTQSFDVLFTCDVLEHLTYKQLQEDFLDQIHHLWLPQLIFICVSCKPANRHFDNGLNAHLIIETAQWWKGVLEGNLNLSYETIFAENNLLREDATFAFKIRGSSPK